MRSIKTLGRKNTKVLTQVINNRVKYLEKFYIKGDTLYIRLDPTELRNYGAANRLRLPSYKDICDAAERTYKNFKMDEVSKICYVFEKVDFSGKIYIEPHFSDVVFLDCLIEDLNIWGGDTIRMFNCKCFSHENFKINCQKIDLDRCKFKNCNEVNLFSHELNISVSHLTALNDIDINSEFVTVSYATLWGQNIKLECNLIDTTKYAYLKANDNFEINCKYNERVNGVNANRVIYNDIDITDSDSMKRPKLLRDLLVDLRELKDFVTKDIEEKTRITKETLEEDSIVKVLNKKNT